MKLQNLTLNQKKKLQKAIKDPQYHRTHLLKSPLYQPQVDIINLIEKRIDEKNGDDICVLSSRQTTKNEADGEVGKRAFLRNAKEGGIIVRTAPTFKPQVVLSMLRLEKTLDADPLLRNIWKRKYGYIYRVGKVEIHFLSSGAEAAVVGSTASLLLDMDEAHKVDEDKFLEDFDPMRAFHAVPCVFWGVASDGTDLLWNRFEGNKVHKPSNNIFLPAPIWCELRPAYATHFNKVVAQLGMKHPVVQTQYMLNPMGSADRYLDDEQIHSILSGKHNRIQSPVSLPGYIQITVDIAGEGTFADQAAINAGADPRKDSTVILISNVDSSTIRHGLPEVRIIDAIQWTGVSLPEQQDRLLKLFYKWNPGKALIDTRGIGEQIATFLSQRFACIRRYKATPKTVNTDCNKTYAYVNNEKIKMFRDDGSPVYKSFVAHLKGAKKEVFQFDQLRVVKRRWDSHIDFLKAVMYQVRLVPNITVVRM